MYLYKEILTKALENEELSIAFLNIIINAAETIELKSYEILQKIKAVTYDDSLEDKERIIQIEQIIASFEDLDGDEYI